MSVGRTLIVLGAVMLIAGLLLTLGEPLPVKIGRLPGDMVFRGKNSVFYFPIVTCVILSILLSLLFSIFRR